MTNEEFYDAEIAPALKTLSERCNERQMPFIAIVEYAIGERGRTQSNLNAVSIEMQMIALCCQAGLNIDGYMLALIKLCDKRGIDYSNSIFMSVSHERPIQRTL
jgi:hypothetical protein